MLSFTKKIFSTALTLAIVSTVTLVETSRSLQSEEFTYVGSSAAIPRNARVPFATYYFRLHVRGSGLSNLLIQLPEGVRITQGIEVINQAKEKVETKTNISLEAKTVTIDFPKLISPGETLTVRMAGVRAPRYRNIWIFPVSGKSIDSNTRQLFGIARIHTSL